MIRPSAFTHEPYLKAVAAERLSRDAAMLGVHESIAGFTVLPLTLWHLLVLRIMGHPILSGQVPTPEQLTQFLWLLSPDFSPGNVKGRKRLQRQCRKLFYPPRYLALFNTAKARSRHDVKRLNKLAQAAKVFDASKAYLEEALQDRPVRRKVNGLLPDYYSDGIAFCAQFAREFGWTEETVMRMPIKRVFQYLNEIKIANGSRTPLCNPSDAVKAKFYQELNQQLSGERQQRNEELKLATLKLAEERKARKRK